jgi:signal transduction histidine kinase
MPEQHSLEERVLVFAPTGRDSLLTCQLLSQTGLPCCSCPSEHELVREIEQGAGTVLVAEEALQPWVIQTLVELLGRQEPWSDLPLIVFARTGGADEAVLSRLSPLSNTTLLERPVRMSTLISAVHAALRARRRQYEVRDLLLRQAEADRRKDEFLAMLGHELRNPLAAIRNALWVLGEVGSRAEPDLRQREVIERQTRHLVRMVDDLLDVSRVTLGKIILKHQPADLEEVVQRCLHDLGLAALAESHGLAIEEDTEPAPVSGDPVRLEQVVCNLVQNAIKYTPRGGTIRLTVRREGEAGVVRVCDTGVGIAVDMLPRIFEPFTQVESSRTRSEGGLGLGLPLVRSLVELHRGEVEAHSNGPGRGAEFVVRLPLRAGEIAPPPRPLRGGPLERHRVGAAHPDHRGQSGRPRVAARPPGDLGARGGSRRDRPPGGREGARGAAARRGAGRHRPARPRRQRGGAAHPGRLRHRAHGADRDDGLRPGGGPPARPAGGVRQLSGQAGRPRPPRAAAGRGAPPHPVYEKLKVFQRASRTSTNGIRFVLITSLRLASQS